MKSITDPRKQLLEAYREEISLALADGEPTARSVTETIKRNYAHLISQVVPDLVDRMVMKDVSDLMKQVAAESQAEADSRQMKLLDIPGLPLAFSFKLDGDEEVHYIARSRAKRVHYVAHLDLLDRQIEADTARRRAVRAALDYMDPLFDRYGESLTTAEVLRLAAQEAA